MAGKGFPELCMHLIRRICLISQLQIMLPAKLIPVINKNNWRTQCTILQLTLYTVYGSFKGNCAMCSFYGLGLPCWYAKEVLPAFHSSRTDVCRRDFSLPFYQQYAIRLHIGFPPNKLASHICPVSNSSNQAA